MKKVLVMGGSYFIGKKIVEKLIDSNYEVTVLNRGSKKIENQKIKQIVCDRNNEKEMYATLNNLKFDIVIDVCGLNKKQIEILCKSIDINALKQFVFISSSAVYSIGELTIPFIETDKVGENIWGDYALNKIEAEKYLEDFFKNLKANLIVFRPPYVYGENNYAQRESFIFDHICNNKPIILPDTNPKLQFIYVCDLANTVVTLLGKNISSHIAIYNIGNKTEVTAKEWVIACAEAVGKKADIIEYDYLQGNRAIRDFFPFLDYDNVLDVSKINLIYSDETDFIVGLKNAYKWYLLERSLIVFKKEVAENERQILESIEYIESAI